MFLSIIIINYNSPELVIECIRSVISQTTRVPFEIIVVDNASRHTGKEDILAASGKVRWIQMDYNSGFARANNQGIRQSKGEVVLLLNGDTLIADRAIERACIQLSESDFVACGVQLQNADGTPQISGNYAMKGGLNYLLPLPFLGNFLKWLAGMLKMKKANVPEAATVEEVDWINGAFLMVKKSCIEKAGLMDEDFFLYAEEAEWCSRLRKFGRLCIFGNLHTIHLQGEVSNETFQSSGKGYYNLFDRKGLQIMLSNLVRIRKEFGVGWFLVILTFYLLEIPILYIGALFSSSYHPKAASGFARNVLKVLRLSGTIIRNKPHFYKVL